MGLKKTFHDARFAGRDFGVEAAEWQPQITPAVLIREPAVKEPAAIYTVATVRDTGDGEFADV